MTLFMLYNYLLVPHTMGTVPSTCETNNIYALLPLKPSNSEERRQERMKRRAKYWESIGVKPRTVVLAPGVPMTASLLCDNSTPFSHKNEIPKAKNTLVRSLPLHQSLWALDEDELDTYTKMIEVLDYIDTINIKNSSSNILDIMDSIDSDICPKTILKERYSIPILDNIYSDSDTF